jgi:hypothetical protein
MLPPMSRLGKLVVPLSLAGTAVIDGDSFTGRFIGRGGELDFERAFTRSQ